MFLNSDEMFIKIDALEMCSWSQYERNNERTTSSCELFRSRHQWRQMVYLKLTPSLGDSSVVPYLEQVMVSQQICWIERACKLAGPLFV